MGYLGPYTCRIILCYSLWLDGQYILNLLPSALANMLITEVYTIKYRVNCINYINCNIP